MDKLIYKTFVWPRNPHTYREEYLREPHFFTADGVTYFKEIGEMQMQITGEGVFFGDTAFDDFKRLSAIFEEKTPGDLNHPIWGIRYCYFTGLEMTQEPKDNCISYRFTFTLSSTNGQVPR